MSDQPASATRTPADGRVVDRTQEPGMPKLSVDGVSMVFGDQTVFEAVNLDVGAGEFLCLIGSSGCGKTTLLNLIAGFMPPTEGEIRVSGRVVDGPGSDRAMVFQDDAVFPWYTVLQNIEYGLKIRKIPKHERRTQARELTELVGLGGREDYYPAQLSGGMRKRVDVARALSVQPEVLLMDEPFAALDAITKAHMQEEFLRMWESRETTVVFVTHDIEEALFLGDRLILMGGNSIMRETKVPFERPRTEEVRTSPELQGMRREVIEYNRSVTQEDESGT